MNKYTRHPYMSGSSAVAVGQRCQSASYGRVIAFPGNASSVTPCPEREFLQVNPARLVSCIGKTTLMHDLLTGDLRGKPFSNAPRYMCVAAGVLYSAIALIALFIPV